MTEVQRYLTSDGRWHVDPVPGDYLMEGVTIASDGVTPARNHVVLEPVASDATTVSFSVYRDGDGPGVTLRPDKARQVACELIAQAARVDELMAARAPRDYDLIDAGGNLWRDQGNDDWREIEEGTAKVCDCGPHPHSWVERKQGPCVEVPRGGAA